MGLSEMVLEIVAEMKAEVDISKPGEWCTKITMWARILETAVKASQGKALPQNFFDSADDQNAAGIAKAREEFRRSKEAITPPRRLEPLPDTPPRFGRIVDGPEAGETIILRPEAKAGEVIHLSSGPYLLGLGDKLTYIKTSKQEDYGCPG